MVKALDRKLFRDLSRLKGQMFTIALVIAAGIAAFVAMRGAYTSIELARVRYYERQGFADVFAYLERAPASVAREIEALPGVARVETRVERPAMVPLEDVAEPLRAQVISFSPDDALNRLQLRSGRWVEPGHNDEVVLIESFADARHLRPGDTIPAVLNGKKRVLSIVGVALSPEYVFAIAAGEMAPDPSRFAVMWMNRDALSAVFRMEGAFNSVSIALQPGASQAGVIEGLDRVLTPYGGLGAFGQEKQPSNYAISGELQQLSSISAIIPLIFLAVASLLVNVVLSRLIHLQRPEIATLKAVGYTDFEVGFHFFKLVLVVIVFGAATGVLVGVYLGTKLVDLYSDFFKFPNLGFTFDAPGASLAIGVSFLAALAGAGNAVRSVMKLPPAEAMRPPAPARYRRSFADRLGIARALGPSLHMIVRELQRRPLRTLLSALAIAASVGLMVVGGWYYDGIRELVDTQFSLVMREDLTVAFTEARPERAIRDLGHLPGVVEAEGLRMVPVRFRSGHAIRDGAIVGYPDGGRLRELRDRYARIVPLPPDGVVMSEVLAHILGVAPGDSIEVEIHEGKRGTRQLTISALVDDGFGLQGHMRASAVQTWLGEEPRVNVGLLRIDSDRASAVDARLKDLPFVLSVTRRSQLLQRFDEQSGNMIKTMAIIIMAFAATITVGVVYNNARVALSLRARDLASLRVLGFSRGEVSAVLLGEMAIQVLLSLPIGLFFGNILVHGVASMIDPEQWRMPVVLTDRGYALAASVALVASAMSALLVRRRIDRLDLIGVLKTRE